MGRATVGNTQGWCQGTMGGGRVPKQEGKLHKSQTKRKRSLVNTRADLAGAAKKKWASSEGEGVPRKKRQKGSTIEEARG